MPNEVFIDATFWVARVYKRDQSYDSARTFWSSMFNQDWQKVTTNWTLYEATTILNGKNVRRHDLALALLNLARQTTTIANAAEYETEALDVFSSHSDKRCSVVDCANFVCIGDRKSNLALSFDGDFAQAQGEFGFRLLGATP